MQSLIELDSITLDRVAMQTIAASGHRAIPATVRLAGAISEDGKLLAKPTLVGTLGERMAIQVGDDVKLALVVKDLAP